MKKFFIVALATTIFFSCGSSKQEPTKTAEEAPVSNLITLTDAQLKNAALEIGTMQEKELQQIIKVNGKIDVPPQNLVSISAPLGGYLKETKLLPGMHIRKGETLAVLEDPQYIELQQNYLATKAKIAYLQADYPRLQAYNQLETNNNEALLKAKQQQTDSKVAYLSSDYERQKTLNQTKATSDKNVQLAKAEMENERLLFETEKTSLQKDMALSTASTNRSVAQIQAEIEQQTIYLASLAQKLRLIGISPDKLRQDNITRTVSIPAPIEGYVASVKVNIGKYLTPSEILFELVNPSDIHLNLHIFEKDIPSLKMGQKITAYTPFQPEKKYPAEIILIGKNIENDHTAEVHCHFENYDANLIPGVFMTAEIQLANASLQALPSDAIVRYENKHYIFLAKEKNTFEMKEIETGATKDNFTAVISSNISELATQKIVTKNAYTLLMKMKNAAEE